VDYRLEYAIEKLNRASELNQEAANLPNPGGFWRGIQSLLVDTSSGERDSDRQARIDEQRQSLLEESNELMREAAVCVKEFVEHLSTCGLDSDRIIGRITRVMGNGAPSQIRRAIAELEETERLLDLRDEMAERAREAREKINDISSDVSQETDTDTEIEIDTSRNW
jgi:hypothetical protein